MKIEIHLIIVTLRPFLVIFYIQLWMQTSTKFNFNLSKGCKRKNVASAVLSSGESYTAARRLKAFMIMHMGLVKTIKLTNKYFSLLSTLKAQVYIDTPKCMIARIWNLTMQYSDCKTPVICLKYS